METLEKKELISTFEWLKTDNLSADPTKMTTLNSDNDPIPTTWTSFDSNDNDD